MYTQRAVCLGEALASSSIDEASDTRAKVIRIVLDISRLAGSGDQITKAAQRKGNSP